MKASYSWHYQATHLLTTSAPAARNRTLIAAGALSSAVDHDGAATRVSRHARDGRRDLRQVIAMPGTIELPGKIRMPPCAGNSAGPRIGCQTSPTTSGAGRRWQAEGARTAATAAVPCARSAPAAAARATARDGWAGAGSAAGTAAPDARRAARCSGAGARLGSCSAGRTCGLLTYLTAVRATLGGAGPPVPGVFALGHRVHPARSRPDERVAGKPPTSRLVVALPAATASDPYHGQHDQQDDQRRATHPHQ